MPLEFLCFCLYPHLQTQRDIPLWNCHFQDPRKYNRAQFILGKHGKPRITPKKDFIYKGIATCGECGCSITAEYKYKAKYDKTYIYYHCTHKRGDCWQGSIEEKELTRQLEAFWNSVEIKKEFFEWGLEAIQAMHSEANAEREKIAEAQTKALSEAQKKADRLLDLVVNGTIGELLCRKP